MHNPLAEQSSNDTANQGVAQLPQVTEPRNPGMELDLDWVARVQANTSAIERRCAALPARRSVKKEHQAAWLLKAVSCIDLTTLSGDDTEMRVGRLCAKARQPVNASVLAQLHDDRSCLCISRDDPSRCSRPCRNEHSSRSCFNWLPCRTFTTSPTHPRNQRKRCSGR